MIETALGAVVLGLLVLWVIRPVLVGDETTSSDRELPRLVEEKEAVLSSLVELEQDLDLGKIDPSDFQVIKSQHEKEALDLLRRIDDARGTADPLEEEIAAARRKLQGKP